jgi:threonine/homoserine/homoserine lactone efflux protein
MNGDAIGMAAFALAGAVTPGPVNLLALRYGTDGGWMRPIGYTLGASLSYGALLWLTGLSAGPLLKTMLLAQLVRWAGAAYLFYLAWRVATAPVSSSAEAVAAERSGAWRAMLAGGLCQVLNPKAWLVAMSGVAVFAAARTEDNTALTLFCMVSMAACAVGVGLWAIAGRVLSRWLMPPRRQRAFNRVLGGSLGIAVLAMVC